MQPSFDLAYGDRDETAELHDEFRSIETPTHPLAVKFLAFWKSRPADGIVIGRDVPSRRIANILSNVILFEPVNGFRDLRVRLAGVAIRHRLDGDIKGKLMSQLFPPEEFRQHIKTAPQVIETNTPLIIDSRLNRGSVEKLHLEVVVLPVFAPNRTDKWILAGYFYFH